MAKCNKAANRAYIDKYVESTIGGFNHILGADNAYTTLHVLYMFIDPQIWVDWCNCYEKLPIIFNFWFVNFLIWILQFKKVMIMPRQGFGQWVFSKLPSTLTNYLALALFVHIHVY